MLELPPIFLASPRMDFDMTNPLVFVVIILMLIFVVVPFAKFVLEMFTGRRFRW